ncbi:MAG: hypothetical protein IJQ81_12690, partial [Oscillibacter sp.]|nr:hypothetical protein [Oscillibacter sp.]
LWNAVTGKNERLRTAIEEDRAAAQYAMQQAINSVLKECTQNRLLALAVKSKLENEMIDQQTPEESDAPTENAWTEEEEAGRMSGEVLELADAPELELTDDTQ